MSWPCIFMRGHMILSDTIYKKVGNCIGNQYQRVSANIGNQFHTMRANITSSVQLMISMKETPSWLILELKTYNKQPLQVHCHHQICLIQKMKISKKKIVGLKKYFKWQKQCEGQIKGYWGSFVVVTVTL